MKIITLEESRIFDESCLTTPPLAENTFNDKTVEVMLQSGFAKQFI